MKKIYTKPEVEIEQTEDVLLASNTSLFDNTGEDNEDWGKVTI
jgi:hypothetical protein